MGPKLKIHIKRGIGVKKVPFLKCAFVLPKNASYMLSTAEENADEMLLIAIVLHTQNRN